MTRVLHTADTHLGYRQYHSAERRSDFLAAFRQVLDDAIESDVDAVVHAGDLFHDRHPDLPDLLGTIDALSDLRDADVPFLGIVGNHETKRDGQWLDLFEALGLATRLDERGTVVGDVTLYGLDYVPPSHRTDLAYEFEPPATDHTALVAHGLFEPFAHANWDTEELLAESTVEFDAVLLGDNHVPDRAKVEDTWVTYCGSTERTSAAEREKRGYNLVTFADGETRISRRTLDATREFAFVDVELAPGEGAERVNERIRELDVEDSVVVVTVDGDGEECTPAEIEAFALEQGALIARVRDRREFGEDVELDVQFADPDRAVRERIRELGLSRAADDLDDAIRNDAIADSNVRETVERRIRDRIAEGIDEFEPAPDTGTEAEDDGESEAENDGESEAENDAETETSTDTDDASGRETTSGPVEEAGKLGGEDDVSEPESDDPGAESDESEVEDAEQEEDGDESNENDDAPAGPEPAPAAPDAVSGEEASADGGEPNGDGTKGEDEEAKKSNGQSSMEEFL